MDLKLIGAEATAIEREVIARICPEPERVDGRVVRGGHQARANRHLLLPALAAVQSEVGWVSPGALDEICRRLDVPPAEAWGVATFYALIATSEHPPRVAHVCDDIGCRQFGATQLIDDLGSRLGPEGSDAEGVSWQRSPCLGQCDRAPAAYLQRAGVEDGVMVNTTASELGDALRTDTGPPAPAVTVPQQGEPGLRLLRRVGVVDPTDIDDYRRHGGYRALRRALELGPDRVIREVKDSGLRGRGGAAFPTGVKWEAVASQPAHPHYLICNADESEPGTFKDRVLMEGDPFALVEAMTIAGWATGCEQGYLYLRGEYPVAAARLSRAIAVARRRGLLGDDVMGAGFRFDIEIRRGQGAYICGEETALMNSIEGYRGEPRNKPPFPTTNGLFGKPTLINNVETLANVLSIVNEGGPAFAETGTGQSTGTRLFCLSGSVERPGVYEVALGTTLGELIDLAGGVRRGETLQAVLIGGAAGAFLTPDQLDFPLSFEASRERGVPLGSGVVMLFDQSIDLADIIQRIAAFFRDETCGQCVPCRVGVVRQEESLARYLSNGHDQRELELLADIDRAMTDASICGLGQTAASAVRSAIRLGLV